VRGLTPIEAGLTLVPLSLAALVTAPLAGRFLHGVAPRWMIGGGLALIGAGVLAQAHLAGGSSWSALLPGLLLVGVGVGLATPILASAALAAVPVQRAGMAAGAVNTTRQLGYALGIAALGLVCQSRIASKIGGAPGVRHAGEAARAITGGQGHRLIASAPPSRRAGIDAAIHSAFASGLNVTMLAAGATGLVASGLVLAMLRRSPEHAPEPEREPAPA
jgi:Major Facilitator Superfamily